MTGSFLKDLMHRVGSLAATEADAPADGSLLARFVRDRDEVAFAGILTRHAPLVWGVCRGLLPVDADAEDAFQATFLALVRGAKAVRTPHSLGPWLHATATRIAKKARLSTVRRAARDRTAARSDANGAAVADSVWECAFLAVHEEIARLPETLRGAFVLCVLEGERHAAAAAKLGVPVGTLAARVSRARQKLMDRLTARGLAPAAAAAALALRGSTGPAAVPTTLLTATSSTLSAGAASIPASVLNLARAATEGSVMKAKLLAAGVLVAAGMALTGGAARLGVAEAQSPLPENGLPGFGGFGGPPASGFTPVYRQAQVWEYKFVSPKQREFFATDEFEQLLTTLGKGGWEYCGTEKLSWEKQVEVKAVFKRPSAATAVTYRPQGKSEPNATASNPQPVTATYPQSSAYGPTNANSFTPAGTPTTSPGYGAGSKATDATALLRLESGNASAVAALVAQALNGPDKKDRLASVTADAAGKQVIIRCTPADAAGIVELLGKTNLVTKLELDFAPAPKPANPATPTAGTPTTPSGRLAPTSIDAPVPFPIPKDVPGELAARIATEVAKAAGLSVSVAQSEDGKILYLSGPADAIEKVRKSLPPVLDALKEKAK
jgi:RNA polymerase sigma factor (sigma-70 family)